MAKSAGSAARARIEEDRNDADRSTEAYAWQREQALSTWEKVKAGDRSEVSKADIDAEFADALDPMGLRSA